MKYLKERYLETIILDELVEIRWCGKNIPHYRSFGYEYTGLYDTVFVLVEHLPHSAKVNVLVQCPICNEARESVYGNIIRYGHTVCPGCSRIIDMTGERYGRWTVIEIDANRNANETAYWMCRCDCGTVSSVSRAALTKGESMSCGCYHKDRISGENNPNWKPNIINTCEYCGIGYEIKPGESEKRRFCSIQCSGKWTSEHMVGENHPSWKGGELTLVCEWCGDEYKKAPSLLKGRKSRFCSNACWGKWYSENMSGENSPNWNSDIPEEERVSRRYLPENYQWVRDVLKRDSYTCQICGKQGGKLEAHHLYSYSDYPEKQLDLDNGLTMCKEEHRDFHKWMGGYRVPCTPSDLDRWLYSQ